MVWFTLHGLGLANRPLRCSRSPFGQVLQAPFRPLVDFSSAPEYGPRLTAAEQLPSWGLVALRRLRQREATYTGFASPGCAASPGSFSLLTPCSSRSFPALFHAGNAHGLSPFRGLLFSRSRRNLSVRLPLLTLFERGSATVTATGILRLPGGSSSPPVATGSQGKPENRPAPRAVTDSRVLRSSTRARDPCRSVAALRSHSDGSRPSRATGPLDGGHCWPPLAFRSPVGRSPGVPPDDAEPGVLPAPKDRPPSASGSRWACSPDRHPEGCWSFRGMSGSVHLRHCLPTTGVRP